MSIKGTSFYLLSFILLNCTIFADEVSKSTKVIVTVKPLSSLIFHAQINIAATVISLNKPIISAQVSAVVKKVYADIGDKLNKGDVLLALDCRDYEYALQQARAALRARKSQANFADKSYQRNQRLLKQSTIPQTTMDKSEADYLAIQADLISLKAQVKQAELAVERCQIKAPFAGEVTQRQVQKGQLVNIGTPLFEFMQSDHLQITAELSAQQVRDIQQADAIYFSANAKKTTIKLVKLVDLLKETTKTQTARFSFVQGNKFIAGTAGRVIWKAGQAKLPAAYISRRNGQFGVLTLQADKKTVHFVPLADVQEGQPVAIDLPLDTWIIDKGRINLKDKQVVSLSDD